jgi:hypothetical protein
MALDSIKTGHGLAGVCDSDCTAPFSVSGDDSFCRKVRGTRGRILFAINSRFSIMHPRHRRRHRRIAKCAPAWGRFASTRPQDFRRSPPALRNYNSFLQSDAIDENFASLLTETNAMHRKLCASRCSARGWWLCQNTRYSPRRQRSSRRQSFAMARTRLHRTRSARYKSKWSWSGLKRSV